jgi:hypothetical protein
MGRCAICGALLCCCGSGAPGAVNSAAPSDSCLLACALPCCGPRLVSKARYGEGDGMGWRQVGWRHCRAVLQ